MENQNLNDTENTQYNEKIPAMCRFFGHKIGELNDGGYPICERCSSHSYYDDWNKSGLLMRPIWTIQRKVYHIKWDLKYWFRRIFLKDDLPF